MVAVVAQMRARRDTAANWTSSDPTLGNGEIAWETDTGLLKIGDGSTAWTSLAYWGTFDDITINDALTVTGLSTFTALAEFNGDILIDNTVPRLTFYESDAALDQKTWFIDATAEALRVGITDDADVNTDIGMQFERTGTGTGVTFDLIYLFANTGEIRLQSDLINFSRPNTEIVVGSASTVKNLINRGGSAGALELSGDAATDFGAAIELYGSIHASQPGDTIFKDGSNQWMVHDASASDLTITADVIIANPHILRFDDLIDATIGASNGDAFILMTQNGRTAITYDNTVRLETYNAGVDITGDLRLDDDIINNGVGGTFRIETIQSSQDMILAVENTGGISHTGVQLYGSVAEPYVGLFWDSVEVMTTIDGGVQITSAQPRLNFSESDATTTNQAWSLYASGERFDLALFDDTFGVGATVFGVNRTANTIDDFLIYASELTLVNGNLILPTSGIIGFAGVTNDCFIQGDADSIDVHINNTNYASFVTDGIGIASSGRLYLDGTLPTGDTYIVEGAGNRIDMVVGGDVDAFQLSTTDATFFGVAQFQSDGDMLMTGYIVQYAGSGTASDGDILEWNDTNGRFEIVTPSGGGIGGSITDNQIAVGATTANDIEGSANFTYDGTSHVLTSTATTQDVMTITANSLTTGRGLVVQSTSGARDTNPLVEIIGNSGQIGSGLEVDHPASGAGIVVTKAGLGEGIVVNHSGTGRALSILGGEAVFAASTTSYPSLQIPEGVAPTSPQDGDVWVTAAGEFFARLNGTSVDLAAGGGGTFTLDSDDNLFGGTNAGANLTATSALDNFLAGTNAGRQITTADNSIAIGNDAMGDATGTVTGNANIAIGWEAMHASTTITGVDNIAIGYQTLDALTSGNLNVAIGWRALSFNAVGIDNIAIGTGACLQVIDDHNIGIGRDALGDVNGASANGNIGIGHKAGEAITTGANNTIVGDNALSNGSAIMTGSNNVAIGASIANGTSPTSLARNVFIGFAAAAQVSSGFSNIIIGDAAGANITTGSQNIILGDAAGPTANQSNRLYIHDAQDDDPTIGGDLSSKLVTFGGALRLTERADHISTPTATFGEIWLDNNADQKLRFTDDQGTDYEISPEYGEYTATFTPATSGTVTLNSSLNTLSYTKIGQLVHVQGYLVVSSISSPVGAIRLNLPFGVKPETEGADAGAAPYFAAGLSNGTLPSNLQLAGVITQSNDTCVLDVRDAATSTSYNLSTYIASGSFFRFDFNYHTDE